MYHSATGAQGHWDSASNSMLENDIGTKNKDEALETILRKGDLHSGKGVGRPKESMGKKCVILD